MLSFGGDFRYRDIFHILLCDITGAENLSMPGMILKSVLQTLVYFGFVEVSSILFLKGKIYKLQIVQLMREKQRNQPLRENKKSFWGWVLIISFFSYLILLSGISFMPDGEWPFAPHLFQFRYYCVFFRFINAYMLLLHRFACRRKTSYIKAACYTSLLK